MKRGKVIREEKKRVRKRTKPCRKNKKDEKKYNNEKTEEGKRSATDSGEMRIFNGTREKIIKKKL